MNKPITCPVSFGTDRMGETWIITSPKTGRKITIPKNFYWRLPTDVVERSRGRETADFTTAELEAVLELSRTWGAWPLPFEISETVKKRMFYAKPMF